MKHSLLASESKIQNSVRQAQDLCNEIFDKPVTNAQSFSSLKPPSLGYSLFDSKFADYEQCEQLHSNISPRYLFKEPQQKCVTHISVDTD